MSASGPSGPLVCKYDEDPFKIESTREVATFLYGDFFRRSRAGKS